MTQLSRRSAWRWMFALVTINLTLGLWLLPSFGESWDEAIMYDYATRTLEYIHALFWGTPKSSVNIHLQFYGVWPWIPPVLLHRLWPTLSETTTIHLVSWLFFQSAGLALFALALRYVRASTALWIAALFFTQPLLWGHGFINLKDTSLLALFLISTWLGLQVTDHPFGSAAQPITLPRFTWSKRSWKSQGTFWAWNAVLLGGGMHWVLASPPAPNTDVTAFALALNRTLFRLILLIGLWASSLLLFLLLQAPASRPNLKQGGKNLLQLFRSPLFWLAAIALGLAAAIRVSGWWAGLIVGLEWIRQRRLEGILAWGAYLALAWGVQTLVWPFTWSAPLSWPLLAALLMSAYPWRGMILFAGHIVPAADLPFWYVPQLQAIQLTEPLVLLAVAGWGWLTLTHRAQLGELWRTAVIWYALPMLGVMLRRPPLYDNARQLLFLLPPLFLIAGAFWEYEVSTLSSRLRGWVSGLLLLPGIIAIAWLHPYPYVYYNLFVGGTQGAFQRYELDYWATSFLEMAQYLDRHPSPALPVVVWGPAHVLDHQRHLTTPLYQGGRESLPDPPFYAVVLVRARWPDEACPQAPLRYAVRLRNGVPLSLLREVSTEEAWHSCTIEGEAPPYPP